MSGSLVSKPTPEYGQLAYTPRDIANLLQLSKSTVYKMIRKGELPGVAQVRGQVRIDRAIFDQWWQEQIDQGVYQ